MKKIVGIIRPFSTVQSLYVLEDGEEIEVVETTLDNLNNTIFTLTDKYNLNCIDLTGPQKFNTGLANNLAKEEMLKYNKTNIYVNII